MHIIVLDVQSPDRADLSAVFADLDRTPRDYNTVSTLWISQFCERKIAKSGKLLLDAVRFQVLNHRRSVDVGTCLKTAIQFRRHDDVIDRVVLVVDGYGLPVDAGFASSVLPSMQNASVDVYMVGCGMKKHIQTF
jgi:hypothetical protein